MVFSMVASLVWAGGKKEEYSDVSGLENWHHEYDISELKPDTYNMVIRARDGAGNVSIAGPINFRVDPLSDIPTISIGSPTQGQRSTGTINVVGTAFDDDAVDFVEVQLGLEGEIFRAQGQRYWSHFFSMSDLQDGVYKVRARVTDTKGIASEWTEVSFNLDQKKPLHTIESHSLGALVKGKIRIEGTILEPNGIDKLYYSVDDQATFSDLNINKANDTGTYKFSFEIDTTLKTDGPNIIWFRSINSLSNTGLSSFLYFSDNTAPEIQLIYPTAESVLPGFVPVVGAVLDQVGVKSVTWEAEGNIQGELELVPGNPYFYIPVTYANQTGTKKIKFTVEDRIGNIRTFEFPVLLNLDKDRPTLTVTSLSDKASVTGPVEIRGFIRDDDAVQALNWTIEGGEKGEVATKGAFSFQLPELISGSKRLTLVAKDVNGVESLPLRLEFTLVAPPPVWEVKNFILQYGGATGRSDPYQPGILLPLEGPNERAPNLVGRIRSMDSHLGDVIYTVPGGRSGKVGLRADGSGFYKFEIPIPDIIKPNTGNINLSGPLEITLSVRGSVGIEVVQKVFILRENSDSLTSGALVFKEGLGSTDLVRVNAEHPFSLLVAASVSSVLVQPPSAALSTELTPVGNLTWIKVLPGANPGLVRSARVSAVSAEGTIELGTFNISSDNQAPVVNLTVPEVSSWLALSMGLAFSVEDTSAIQAAEYSFDGTNYKAVPGAAAGAKTYNSQISLAEIPDGDLTLFLRVRDESGNESITARPVFKNAAPPVVRIVAPSTELNVDGKTRIVGVVESSSPLIKLEYSENGTVWEAMDIGQSFERFIDFSRPNLPAAFKFRATSASGVIGLLDAKFTIDSSADKPKVSIQIPGPAETLRGDFFISGLVVDDDDVGSIYVRLDAQGDFKKLDGSNSFSVPVTLLEIEDAKHFVEVYAEDINGTRSLTVKQEFTVSRSGPVSQLKTPDIKITQKGMVALQGTSQDPNGVEKVFLSVDNGNTFYRMEGKEQWSYQLDTSLIQDGIYTLLVRSIDTTGAVGDYNVLFSVDNKKPEITLTSPLDGSQVSGILSFEGRADDNRVLRTLRYSIRPIGAVRTPVTGDFPVTGGITQQVDISALQPGWYNVSLEAADDAGNVTLETRNVQVMEQTVADRVELSFPALGQNVSGPIMVMGRVFAKVMPEKAVVSVGGRVIQTVDINQQGYFSGFVQPNDILGQITDANRLPGNRQTLEIKVEIDTDGKKVISPARTFDYQIQGPWIQVTSHKHGDFISNRPYLTGSAGYFTLPQEAPAEALPEGQTQPPPKYGELQLTLEEIQRNPISLEISLNNGMSFQPVEHWEAKVAEGSPVMKGDREWRYRLQTHNFAQGPLTVLLRSHFADNSTSTTRLILVTDTVAPKVEILVPEQAEGGFNETLQLAGTAFDDSMLSDVEIMLNKGRYTPPSFIEGVYADAYYGGATTWSAGLGFFFFQQAVRLQVQTGFIGLSEQNSRFYGYAHGVKLMAKVFNFGWSSVFGPDAEAFSSNLIIGANFTYFTQDEVSMAFNDKGVALAAMLGQIEALQISSDEWPFFNSISLYFEGIGWLISSDVKPTIFPKWSAGIRFNIWSQIKE